MEVVLTPTRNQGESGDRPQHEIFSLSACVGVHPACATESSSQRMWAQSGSVGHGRACIANGTFHALLADEEISAFISQPERPMK